MPVFEYQCQYCSHTFERLELSRSKPAATCTACGAADVRKQLSVFAVGSGEKSSAAPAPCGTCGDPRGPGSCRMS